MSDAIDKAQELQDLLNKNALKKHKDKACLVSTHFCEDCDIEIPEKRREAIKGVCRCVNCQEIFEAKNKHWKR
ncbi:MULTISPECIES: TraR/DksA family transcriptional regulator [Pasteurellaceae]|uniref:TraR/DksA family transcriptional regulator n=1 Tax=Pasteurella atlantica TaxID=2827233 RepID=A0AAW8CSV1_9PAST|nr:TraR/DksA family transcriptional regulator [Pasteurella atlantica]MBR0573346.1 TraR/DksA family transcriptional regulator [Pasteurella atlantica]MDP8040472.1 TraR/DksA family transcriptional regulator [Pasteurella atlantica]MDP8041863.1 TraR/DksA family transcriptional regulator [Pasteurella atlantica]MDP8043930.1 TraR/DksA family transcriptional regulator [Pasteurella atlantica]MDP8046791.1 TraR/DksA family transcriptional regulator [Pasteurella atlantica]